MSTADPRRAFVRRWLAKARTDLTLASVVLEQGPEMDPWVCCFHAQQAAEKALKAVLVARGEEPPRIHDLGALAAVMPGDLALDLRGDDLGDLTTFATAARYVLDAGTEAEEPTWDDAARSVVVAAGILTAIGAYLNESG